jgi:hypothetical protein
MPLVVRIRGTTMHHPAIVKYQQSAFGDIDRFTTLLKSREKLLCRPFSGSTRWPCASDPHHLGIVQLMTQQVVTEPY